MDNKRVAISKKLRFEIFKRDGFKCQYCGSVPPNVILEVDHIFPVFKGGKNNIDNLLTACFSCNRGKGKNELTVLPDSIDNKASILKEKIHQYKEYQKLQLQMETCIQDDINKVSDAYTKCFSEWYLKDKFLQSSVKKFILELGVDIVVSAMYASANKTHDADKSIKYFCAICWNKIKGF